MADNRESEQYLEALDRIGGRRKDRATYGGRGRSMMTDDERRRREETRFYPNDNIETGLLADRNRYPGHQVMVPEREEHTGMGRDIDWYARRSRPGTGYFGWDEPRNKDYRSVLFGWNNREGERK